MPVMDKLICGTGTSVREDATAAGHEAARAAVAPLDGAAPSLVLVYSSLAYDLPALLAAIRAVTGDAHLVGATSSGVFATGELIPPGGGVAVLALAGGPYRFGVSSVTGLRADTFAAGQELARGAVAAAGPDNGAYGTLLLHADGLAGDMQGLLNGIYRVTGAKVPVVGGAAAADRQLTATYVFHDGRVLHDGAVAVWIGSTQPLNVVHAHGWQAHGLPLLVTKVDGTRVHEIAGRPAQDVVRENFRYDDPAQEITSDRAQGYHSAHAFGLLEPDGTQLIRGAYFDGEGMVQTFTPLPLYSAVQIVSSGPDELLDISEQIVADALSGVGASVLLTFSCVARLDILGERGPEEPARLQAAAGAVPTFGFFTYGEFARTSSVAGYHNATVAALAL
jgi:hypothetical protein